jgi:hypothetical protein
LDNWQPSVLSWSCSRKTHFDSCKRHYFYHRFWGQEKKSMWRMYEMRCITTMKILQGSVVHDVIAEALKSARQGSIIEPGQLKKRVTSLMWEKFSESSDRLWEYGNRPPGRKQNDITNLLEHYYSFPDAMERAREARNAGWQCIENLLGSDLWRDIIASDREGWREIDEDGFPSFDLDGIMTYACIDFAFRGDTPTIIDWKTGRPGADPRTQLTLYSLYAQSKWGWKPEQTRLMAVYLQPDLNVEEFSPTPQDVEATEETVKRSFAEMVEMEPGFGPADIANFPITEDVWNCRWCRFQGICEGAKRLDPGESAPELASEPAWE